MSDELSQNLLHWKPDGYTMILLCIPEEKMTAYQYTPKKKSEQHKYGQRPSMNYMNFFFYFIIGSHIGLCLAIN